MGKKKEESVTYVDSKGKSVCFPIITGRKKIIRIRINQNRAQK